MAKYLDNEGLLYLWQKIKNTFARVTHSHAISDVTDLQTTLDGKAASSHSHAIADVTNLQSTLDGKAPKSHASTATTYGAGTGSNYGHVKLSDATNGTAAAASGGTAATPKAVSDALAAAKSYADGLDTGVTSVAGKTGAVTLDKSDVGLGNVDNTADADKVVASAGKLTTAQSIDGVSFDGSKSIIHYGVCDTGASTAVKQVYISTQSFVVAAGTWIAVKFTNTNTAAPSALKLTVNSLPTNGTNGNIRYRGSYLPSADILSAGRVYLFVYDGTGWELIGDLDTDTTYTHPSYDAADAAAVKIGRDASGHVVIGDALTASDVGASATGHKHAAGDITSGTLGVARGGTGASTLGAGVVYHSASGTGALSIATAANLVNAIGTPAVKRATADASGNNIADTYAKKADIAGMYKYKGSVADDAHLPTTGQTTGDVYNIESAGAYGGAGANVAWNGTAWDALGEIFSIESITNSEIDTIVAS